MENTLTFSLGPQEYTIKDLTLEQVEGIEELMEMHDGRINVPKENRRKIIAVALSEDYPALTAEHLKKVRVGRAAPISVAVLAILRFGGWAATEEQAEEGASSGEAASP